MPKILAVLFLGGGVLISGPVSCLEASTYNVQLAPPAVALDLTDLDPRDEKNRPIRSVQAIQQMKMLFVETLNEALLLNLTQRVRDLNLRLAKTWDVISGWLKTATQHTAAWVDAWFQNKKEVKKLHRALHRLSVNLKASDAKVSDEDQGGYVRFLLSSILSSTCLLR